MIRATTCAQAPIRHLLFLGFLGVDLDDFFSLATEPTKKAHVIRANVKCLNILCPMHDKASAAFVSAHFSRPLRGAVELYHCDTCGQTRAYCSIGHERSWVRDYGRLWKEKLAELWSNPKVSQRSIAQQLAVSCDTVKSQAIKSGLAFPRPFRKRFSTHRFDHLFRSKSTRRMAKLKRYRIRWLSMRAHHPESKASHLRIRCPALYAFLSRYDHDWLAKNQPNGWWPKGKPKVDWSARDEILCKEIKKTAAQLRLGVTPPHKLTANALGRAVGLKAWLWHRLERLPKSRAALIHETRMPTDKTIQPEASDSNSAST
jgi:hypothetical protein